MNRICFPKYVARRIALAGCAVAATCAGATDAEAQDRVRLPAVQGQFYPAERDTLKREVESLLAHPPAVRLTGRVRALIAPHAGYRYSGAVAAQGFAQIPVDTRRVILLAPCHRVKLRGGGSILDVRAYRNALGDVPLDPAAAELRRAYPFFDSLPPAHAREHALEVMLPFLQCRLKTFTIVPVVLGTEFDASAVAAALMPLLDSKTVVVASSDLSHYKPPAEAETLDRDCIRTILEMDVAALQDKQLCGKGPVAVLLHLATASAWTPTLIDYKHSGETAGPSQAVVGYACIGFTQTELATTGVKAEAAAEGQGDLPPQDEQPDPNARHRYEGDVLSDAEQMLLLDLARRSIMAKLLDKELPQVPAYSESLLQKLGCFVTLEKNGELRGCIGHIFPVHPLAQGVQTNALSAAFNDRRFRPVTLEEMKTIDLEISVLTQPRKLDYATAAELLRKLQPGVHGVVISQGETRRSTYLPQVWEQIPNPLQFLSMLCRKGGMPLDAWQDPQKTRIEVYEAFVFGERDHDQTE